MQSQQTPSGWTRIANDKSALLAWFHEHLDAGRLDVVADGMSLLDARHGDTIAHAFVQAERRHPYDPRQATSADKADPISRLVGILADHHTPQLVDILDNVSTCLREYGHVERAMEMYERLGESYERNGELIALARTWMWRGRSHADQKTQGKDLPCYWKALSVFQHVYAMPGASEDDRRKAARGVSSIQHQFAVKCEGKEDDALLYNYRALILREALKDDHLRSGSFHNIAQRYQGRDDYGKALLNFLQAVRLDITSSWDHDRKITYGNLANLCWNLGEYETALLLYRKAELFGIKTFAITRNIVALLMILKRHPEAIAELSATVEDTPLTSLQRLDVHYLLLQIYGRTEDSAQVEKCLDQLVAGLLEANQTVEFKEEEVQKRIRGRLAALTGSPHRLKALLLYAVGERANAMHEIAAGLQDPATPKEEAGRLAELGQQSADKAPAEKASQSTQGQTSSQAQVCRACQSEFLADKAEADGPVAGPGGPLCPLCAEAMQMEDLVLIPAGKAVAKDYLTADLPSFYIDKYFVTNRLFHLYHQACRLDWEPECWKRTLWQDPDQPMTCVTLADGEAFCAWRSRLTGRSYRIPTQEQWFRAALGDDARTYPWGNESPDHTRAAYSLIEDRDAVPPPVGMFPAGASPFGVHDMAGTVWEYTSTKDKDGNIVYLGGSCDCPVECLSPNQELYRSMISQSLTDRTDFQMGFRCVAEVGL